MEGIKQANSILKKNNVKWILGQFTDLLGYLRSYTSPVEEFINRDMWKNGISIDGSSVGFSDVSKSDMNIVPDPETVQILPWVPTEQKTACVTMELLESKTWKPFAGAPRNIAKRADADAKAAGFDNVWISPELEYYIFNSLNDAVLENEIWNSNVQPGLENIRTPTYTLQKYSTPRYLPKPEQSYFISPPLDITDDLRNEFSQTLLEFGIPVKYHHHETGSNQVEVEFRAVPTTIKAGDYAILYKFAARNIAVKHGFLPTFMPKPIAVDSGSGMHAHMTLWKNGKTCFFDKNDPNSLSQTARYYIGGILEHAQGMCAITNPTINSYKRLVPDSEAPVYIAWSALNRSALIRVPDHTDDPLTVNSEARHPDPSGNPYLVFAVLLQAGLDGIKKKIDPGEPVDMNIYKLSLQERREYNIKQLPNTLGSALEYLESDEIIQRALGNEVYERFLDLKRAEWRSFCKIVSPWEHYKYFDI